MFARLFSCLYYQGSTAACILARHCQNQRPIGPSGVPRPAWARHSTPRCGDRSRCHLPCCCRRCCGRPDTMSGAKATVTKAAHLN